MADRTINLVVAVETSHVLAIAQHNVNKLIHRVVFSNNHVPLGKVQHQPKEREDARVEDAVVVENVLHKLFRQKRQLCRGRKRDAAALFNLKT
jgi:hypothetical protein